MVGFLGDMKAVYSKANIVILPSFGEGIPTVLLEAGASGRTIIACDVPGCRDVVQDGETGLPIPPDNLGMLVKALHQLTSDPVLRAKFSAAGRVRVVDRFSKETINRQTMEVYANLGNYL